MIWHSVISASGIRVRYNPSTQELRFVCAKHVVIRLTELSDSYAIQVLLSSSKASGKPPLPPQWQKNRPNQRLKPLGTKKVLGYLIPPDQLLI